MAVPKICGVETEFGIFVRGRTESNPIAASSILINAYVQELVRSGQAARTAPRVGWDFEDEMPHNDARGTTPAGASPPEIETHLVNAVLTNGARYYVDHAHHKHSPLLLSPAYAGRARDAPLDLARAWLRCFRSFAERGGFVLTDFKPAQFALDGLGRRVAARNDGGQRRGARPGRPERSEAREGAVMPRRRAASQRRG